MLLTGDYTPAQHSKHLEFISRWIIPLLGPEPRSVNGKNIPAYPSYMCDDYTPAEFSICWKSHSSKPLMRLGIEPLPSHEQADPVQLVSCGLLAIDNFHRSFSGPVSASSDYLVVDPSLFMSVLKSIGFTNDQQGISIVSNIFLAFDFLPCRVQQKSYCILNSSLDSGEKLALVTKAISVHVSEAAASVMSTYFQSKTPDWHTTFSPDPCIIGVDCTGIRDARIKIYIRYQVTDLTNIVDQLSLGGRIQVSSACIKTLSELWRMFGGHPYLRSSHTSGVIFYYEFNATKSLPNVKVNIPVRLMARDDREIMDTTVEWLGNHPHFSSYRKYFLRTVSEAWYGRYFFMI